MIAQVQLFPNGENASQPALFTRAPVQSSTLGRQLLETVVMTLKSADRNLFGSEWSLVYRSDWQQVTSSAGGLVYLEVNPELPLSKMVSAESTSSAAASEQQPQNELSLWVGPTHILRACMALPPGKLGVLVTSILKTAQTPTFVPAVYGCSLAHSAALDPMEPRRAVNAHVQTNPEMLFKFRIVSTTTFAEVLEECLRKAQELQPHCDLSSWRIACKGSFGSDSFFPNPELIIWTRYDEDAPDSFSVYIVPFSQPDKPARKGVLELRIDSLFSFELPPTSARSKRPSNSQSSSLASNPIQEKAEMRNLYFLHCVHRGDFDRCVELVESNTVDVNAVDYDGRTALHIAAADGRLDLVRELLSRGAQLTAKDRWGWSPQDEALFFKRDPVLALLRDQGAKGVPSSVGSSHLCEAAKAADVESIKRYVFCGLPVNSLDYEDRTALHVACSAGHLSVVRVLLMLGAEPLLKDKWGRIALEYAKSSGHAEIVEFLGYFSRDHQALGPSSSGSPMPDSPRAAEPVSPLASPSLTRRTSTMTLEHKPSGFLEASSSSNSSSSNGGGNPGPASCSATPTETGEGPQPMISASLQKRPVAELQNMQRDLFVGSSGGTPDLESLDIEYSELQFQRELSRGAFGVVFLGKHQSRVVAIKEIHGDGSDEQQRLIMILQLRREIAALSTLQHPNIVRLYGVCFSPPKVALVTEFIRGHTLFGYLKTYAATPHETREIVCQALEFALQLCRAIGHIHSLHIVHRDLKSMNVMVEDDTLRLVVIDFGSARVTRLHESELTAGCGSFRWMAPELFKSAQYTEKVDVFAFGIMLWELLHPGNLPLAHYPPAGAASAMAFRGLRPMITTPLAPRLSKLLRSCWAGSPCDRPSFTEIEETLINDAAPLRSPLTKKSSLLKFLK